MKKFFATLICMTVMSPIFAQSISYVENSGSWYYSYDSNGKKIATTSVSSLGNLQGWGTDIIVFKNGSWIYITDAKFKKLTTMSASSVGDIIGVSGSTFTSRNGSWIYTFDKSGKKLSTRSTR